jgi:hypothetical protein
MRNKKTDIWSYTHKKTVRDYYKEIYANTFKNWNKLGQIPRKMKLPTITQEEIKNWTHNLESWRKLQGQVFPWWILPDI